MYRRYKLSNDEHWLYIVKQENRKLRKMLVSETKRVIQKKAEGANTKGFWQLVGQLQGKISRSDPIIKIDGKTVTDQEILANLFADFFEEKISKLTSQMPPIEMRVVEHEKMLPFTIEELNASLKHFKTKMSAGPDGLPMRLIKFYAEKRPLETLSIFNNILEHGFPDKWRLARVTPVPKKGNLSDLSNYRPVSNLSSLSKLFERCVLHRLMNLPNYGELLGDNQHGFRQNHSTTTCLMTLKDEICEGLDAKQKVIVYSLDLSAAFDMLRPDTFKELLKDKIPRPLLGMIDEFLTNRKFYVEMNGKASAIKYIDRGCPQGSVLGPVLFNLYTGTVKAHLPSDVMLTSYADDSYVVIRDTNEKEIIKRTEECLIRHIDSLEAIGMKVNQSKTEIIAFGKDQPPVSINVKGTQVETKEVIKALGIQIDKGLTWTPHIQSLKKRLMCIIGGVRIIRNKLTTQQATKVVTAQVFSILYYACVTWLTPALNRKELKIIERLHYTSLRLIIRDYRKRVSRTDINLQTKRLPPDKWTHYSMASAFLNFFNTKEPEKLLQNISKNTYSKTRKTGFLYGYDASKSKIGKQVSRNWIGSALRFIEEPWTENQLSKDSIRTLLKRSFSKVQINT